MMAVPTGRSLACILAIGILAFVVRCASGAEGANGTATAGWAEVDITPPLGIALGGRGGPETLARKVRDPLFAQLIYLKDSKGKGFVLVSFDLVGLPHELSDRLRMAISQELAVEWNL